MCAWTLNFIYVMCATIKHVTDSNRHMFHLPFFLFSFFFFFFFLFVVVVLVPLIVRYFL
jgi:hypothetical protein